MPSSTILLAAGDRSNPSNVLLYPATLIPPQNGGGDRRVVLRNFLTPTRRDERNDELVLALLGVL